MSSKRPIKNIYLMKEGLGRGGFGVVKTAHLKSDYEKLYAAKIIDKSKLENNQDLLLKELEILKQLDHPNIIKFYEVY